ncbi:Smr/MutS family protein [Sphingorhabdus sp. Alg239-R122]|uniref:Smr/MutS family protein n=1 Tax=Sphingorhabdus sp. Alg239-R122 TaxID=2305989 RepID=UPI0013DD1256|nr:Smr/MutS family protein [Sphingorhabdus sp. Alg239-R122]
MNRKNGPLSPQEAALWNKVAATVEPLEVKHLAKPVPQAGVFNELPIQRPSRKQFDALLAGAPTTKPGKSPPVARVASVAVPAIAIGQGLDSHWNRRFARGRIEPDLTVDLHGHTLSTAYTQLDQSLALAIGAGFRVILLITGKARSEDARDTRGNRRGAIRAAVSDWLAASRHAPSIAAVRNAHPKHGGNGALYIVLKR